MIPLSYQRGLLLFVSVACLFLELLLIRWVATEINIFAYLQNTILVVCFLGLGVGCFRSQKQIALEETFLALALLVTLCAFPLTRRGLANTGVLLSSLGDLLVWERAIESSLLVTAYQVTLGLLITLLVMAVLFRAFVPIGQITARLIDHYPKVIVAYSLNVVGSLLGIWLFVGLGVLQFPPQVWLLIGVVLLFPLVQNFSKRPWLSFMTGVYIATVAWFSFTDSSALDVLWSPYQKLTVHKVSRTPSPNSLPNSFNGYLVNVNNTGYQGMIDRERTAKDPTVSTPEMREFSQYDLPLLFHPHPRRVLIVGAGTGNDVAGALRHGVENVTAVEIDPVIIALGEKYHPEQPYSSPKVQLVNDDARSFFASSEDRFDVISFGLLDSHTTTAMTNARLDHYVYTKESLTQARRLLAKGGVMTLTFEAQKPYIADRIGRALREIFAQEPRIFWVPSTAYGWGGLMFVVGDQPAIATQLTRNPTLAQLITAWETERPVDLAYTTTVTTDDWPYLYLRSPSIPLLYFLLALLTGILCWYGKWHYRESLFPTTWQRGDWHFFFLGAAFLLLEVQNISKASVVLGSTWLVNAIIISGVLVMVLLANFVVSVIRNIPDGLIYLLLLSASVMLYFLDLAAFNSLPLVQKSLIVGLLTTSPMFFSGIIFIRSFARTARKDLALGSNLLGALIGAMLQSLSFIFGIRFLLVIVLLCYLAACMTREPSETAA